MIIKKITKKIFVLVAVVQCFAFPLSAQSGKKPNLLFIMTDQQRYDAISFAGLNDVLHTPNIDRIASDGVWFKNAYTQYAVCAPARATILTGHAAWNTKMFGNGPAYDEPETGIMYMQTFDEILAENGYNCEYYGKWHTPLHHATVYNNPVTPTGSRNGYLSEVSAYREDLLNDAFPYREPVEPQLEDTYTKRPYNPDPIDLRVQPDYNGDKPRQGDIHGVTTIPADMQISSWEADQTIDAIERLKDNPFSITCSFHHPHPPFLPTQDYMDLFNPEDMPLPENWTDNLTNSPYGKYKADERYSDPDKLRHFVAEYYALVKEIDDAGATGMYISVFKLANERGVFRETSKLSIIK